MDLGHRIVLCFVALLGMGAVTAVVIERYGARGPQPMDTREFPDLSTAATVEIRDRSDRPLMGGRFELRPTTSASVLRTAQLLADDGHAVGKVEIELVRHPNGALVQELEVDVNGLPVQAAFAILVDGVHTGWLSTDALAVASSSGTDG